MMDTLAPNLLSKFWRFLQRNPKDGGMEEVFLVFIIFNILINPDE